MRFYIQIAACANKCAYLLILCGFAHISFKASFLKMCRTPYLPYLFWRRSSFPVPSSTILFAAGIFAMLKSSLSSTSTPSQSINQLINLYTYTFWLAYIETKSLFCSSFKHVEGRLVSMGARKKHF